jgi:hypothetical protein
MRTYLIEETDEHGKIQKVYEFENGFGASVIKGPHTYGGPEGLWEIGVIIFKEGGQWNLTYNTSVTDDVLGHLDDDEVNQYLNEIKELKRRIRL